MPSDEAVRRLLSEIADLKRRVDALETTDGPAVNVSLTDGVTAPSTETGIARIYVDTSDGDLKVKFGDGTTKTIVVDT